MSINTPNNSDYDDSDTPIAPVSIDPDAITTSSLKALQSTDQRKIMDIVDKLRRTGLNGIVGLPQLVVCGDQSSGKSSILEAITEIPFPRKENLCTRFATEIILRRSPSSTISITINPDKNRPKHEVTKLRSFHKSITNFLELPDIIEEATQVMGLGRVGEINSHAFSRDVLSVEICGPDRPQLSIQRTPTRGSVGISSLHELLSKLLLSHLIKELPHLQDEMATKYQSTLDNIQKLGEKRSTAYEQRMMLMKISMHTHDIIKSAIKGSYEHDFFGSVSIDTAVDSAENIRRFRAVIQHLNVISEDDDSDVDNDDKAQSEPDDLESLPTRTFLPQPKLFTRNEAIIWVQRVLERSRGTELPGYVNSMLISQLFWEQSQPWQQIASEHIATVAKKCKQFVYAFLQHTAPSEFHGQIGGISVDAALKNALEECKNELRKIVEDKPRDPMTYNHYYTTTIQKMRQEKHRSIGKRARHESETEYRQTNGGPVTLLNPDKMEKCFEDALEKNMDKFSSQEALDNQRAYYKNEIKYFINVVCKAAVERHLVSPLPEIILSPLVVTKLTDKQIEFIAAESHEITQQREYLESRKVMIETGMDIFREAMGGLGR
ncbi:unnamed protein product [Periconia digitata]|uniref:GED domain-containing protein n=1 Tax=Periconia digitata TaxID=1303443 RepID=A0A9W4UX53_9PLEO|nr:unnamed protein product [Periconia digitata]